MALRRIRPHVSPLRLGPILLAAIVLGAFAAPGAHGYIYWANYNGKTIGRANLDATGADQSFVSVGAKWTDGLAVDAQHIYWTNYSAGTIGRANIDGTGANPSFLVNGTTGPAGIAVDGNYIYFAKQDAGAIARARLDGTGSVNTSFIPGPNLPEGVAVDGSHIYWANDGDDTIGRADLNGANVKENFITGAHSPYGVAVDGSHIYWANFGGMGGGRSIGRANLDGTSPDQNFIYLVSAMTPAPAGLAVDAQHIYWADFMTNQIEFTNIDGSGAPRAISGATGPAGVAVDSLPLPFTPVTTPTVGPGGAGPGSGTTPGSSSAQSRAVISALGETNSVFAVARGSTPRTGQAAAATHRKGTVFSFRLDRAANVKIAIQSSARGRRVGRVCKRETPRLRHRPRCTRTVTFAVLTRSGHAGLNKVPFTGRVKGKALRPGRYEAVFVAVDAAGTSQPRAIKLKVVKR